MFRSANGSARFRTVTPKTSFSGWRGATTPSMILSRTHACTRREYGTRQWTSTTGRVGRATGLGASIQRLRRPSRASRRRGGFEGAYRALYVVARFSPLLVSTLFALGGRPSSSSPRRRSPGAPWRSARVSDVRDGHQRSEPASQSANSRPAPPWLEHGVAGYPRGSQLLQVRGLHQGWHLGGRRGSRRRGSARESTRWREGCRTWRDSLLARPTAFCKARGRLASSRPSGRSSRCSDGGGPLVKAGTRRRTPTSAERGEARRRPRDAYARRARRRPR